jgi:hypothetical protein
MTKADWMPLAIFLVLFLICMGGGIGNTMVLLFLAYVLIASVTGGKRR